MSFSRRHFFRIAGTSLVASYFADVFEPRLLLGATTNAAPSLRNSAKSCIFIFLAGAPSQTDMWDMKEGAWTPSDLAPTSYGDVRWPQGLLPKTAAHLGKLSIVRSGLAIADGASLEPRTRSASMRPADDVGGEASFVPL